MGWLSLVSVHTMPQNLSVGAERPPPPLGCELRCVRSSDTLHLHSFLFQGRVLFSVIHFKMRIFRKGRDKGWFSSKSSPLHTASIELAKNPSLFLMLLSLWFITYMHWKFIISALLKIMVCKMLNLDPCREICKPRYKIWSVFIYWKELVNIIGYL